MIYVVAGDAKTQLELIKNLGFGEPVLLDRDGNKL
jgi:zinc protease